MAVLHFCKRHAELTGRHCRHKSIIAYLSANNLPNATAALRTELNLSEDTFDVATAKKYETLLEKKWTSIVRLQKKARLPPPSITRWLSSCLRPRVLVLV